MGLTKTDREALVREGQPEIVDVLGVRIAAIEIEDVLDWFDKAIASGGHHTVAPVNIHLINMAQHDPTVMEFFTNSDLVFTDGTGPVVAARLLGEKIPGRVTAIDVLHGLCDRWKDTEIGIYFLGGPDGVAEQAQAVLEEAHPGVNIVGTHRGHLTTDALQREALDDIADRKPDLLCIGFGCPRQERFYMKHAAELAAVPIVWPVGALTTHIAGIVPRAPQWMQDRGLEWLHRLRLEPRRLAGRYLIGNPLFMTRVVAQRFRGSPHDV